MNKGQRPGTNDTGKPWYVPTEQGQSARTNPTLAVETPDGLPPTNKSLSSRIDTFIKGYMGDYWKLRSSGKFGKPTAKPEFGETLKIPKIKKPKPPVSKGGPGSGGRPAGWKLYEHRTKDSALNRLRATRDAERQEKLENSPAAALREINAPKPPVSKGGAGSGRKPGTAKVRTGNFLGDFPYDANTKENVIPSVRSDTRSKFGEGIRVRGRGPRKPFREQYGRTAEYPGGPAVGTWRANQDLPLEHAERVSLYRKPSYKSIAKSIDIFIKKFDTSSAFAVATDKAKKQGHSDFSEGSAGREKRDEIAEAIKRKKGIPIK